MEDLQAGWALGLGLGDPLSFTPSMTICPRALAQVPTGDESREPGFHPRGVSSDAQLAWILGSHADAASLGCCFS